MCEEWGGRHRPLPVVRQRVDAAAVLRFCEPLLHPCSPANVTVDQGWLLEALRDYIPQVSLPHRLRRLCQCKDQRGTRKFRRAHNTASMLSRCSRFFSFRFRP